MSKLVYLKPKTNKIMNKVHTNINKIYVRIRKININSILQIIVILFLLYCIYNYIQQIYNLDTTLDFDLVSNLFNSNIDKNSNHNDNGIDNTNDLKFYKCSKYLNNKPTELGLQEAGYSKITDKSGNWELYVPCGYNYVEDELREIDLNKINNGKSNNKVLKVFGIDGCDKIASKNYLWKLLVTTHGRNGASQIMPLSYQVADDIDMKHFKNEFDENQIYILKKNIQQKKGIKIMKSNYQEIKKEAVGDNYKVIQTYLNNPYLINKRKVNLRIYLVIICYPSSMFENTFLNDTHQMMLNNNTVNKNDTITKYYLYNEGKCIYTNQDYSNDIENTESHLTSVNLDEKIYESNPESLQELETHLGNNKYSQLWNQILDIIKKTTIATEKNVCKYQNINQTVRFQLFGGDIILGIDNTNKIKPYLLEFNKGPSMKYVSPNDEILKTTLFTDLFCLANVSCQEKCNKDEIRKKWIEIN
jgi:hypothetical protein